MKRFVNRRNTRSFKNESVEDPRELLLSLVDLGSLDAEEALLACVKEMSDAECKRVLGSLSLPNGVEEVEDDIDGDLFPLDDEIIDDSEDESAVEDESTDEEQVEDEAADTEECVNRRLEAKIRRLERILRLEKVIKNEGAYSKAVPDKEIPNYIKELYTKELKDYFKNHIFSKYTELTPRKLVEFLEKIKGEMKFIMGTVMSNVIYSGKIEDRDNGVCRRLFMDITDNPKPKTAFLKELYEKYLLDINENISAGSNDDMSDDELASVVEDWFTDNMAPRRYDYEKEWLNDLRYMAKGRPNGSAIDDCMSEIEAPEEDYDKVLGMLAELAKNAIAEHKENKRRGYDGVGAWRIDHF